MRDITTAALVSELVEAADDKQLSRVVGRYARLDLLRLDETGYVHLDPRGAELLFQIITAREERASIGESLLDVITCTGDVQAEVAPTSVDICARSYGLHTYCG